MSGISCSKVKNESRTSYTPNKAKVVQAMLLAKHSKNAIP